MLLSFIWDLFGWGSTPKEAEKQTGGWTRYSEEYVKRGKFPFKQEFNILSNVAIPEINIYDVHSNILNRTHDYLDVISDVRCNYNHTSNTESNIEKSINISIDVVSKIYDREYKYFDITSRIPLITNTDIDIRGDISIDYNDTVSICGKKININNHIQNIKIKNILDVINIIDNIGE